MLRFLLLAVLLACVSAFVPPATLAQRSVVGRAASVEMGASKGNIMDTDSSGSLTLEEVLWFAQGTGASQNQAAQTFRSQDIDGDGVISWHEFDGPKTGPMGVDVKSLKDEP